MDPLKLPDLTDEASLTAVKGMMSGGIPEGAEVPLLAYAYCYESYVDTTPRKLARKAIKKHGSPALKAAQKHISRRNYCSSATAESKLPEDLKVLAQIDGFDSQHFVRCLLALENSRYIRAAFARHGREADLRQWLERFDNTVPYTAFYTRQPAALIDLFWTIPTLTAAEVSPDGAYDWPDDLSHMTALASVDLMFEGIDAVPEALKTLPALRALKVSHAPLAALPAWLAEIPTLETITVYGCPELVVPEALRGMIRS